MKSVNLKSIDFKLTDFILIYPRQLLHLFLRIIHQVQSLCRTCERRIQPTKIIRSQIFVRHISLIQEHILPLSALCFMACHRIRILHLQCIIMRVSFHLLHPVTLIRNIYIVFQYRIKQSVIIHLRQCRCV